MQHVYTFIHKEFTNKSVSLNLCRIVHSVVGVLILLPFSGFVLRILSQLFYAFSTRANPDTLNIHEIPIILRSYSAAFCR